MTKPLYYNSVSATGDPRAGMGYGKSQKIPSMGTGLGSEFPMGSSVTGIYTEPAEDTGIEDEDFGFDQDELDKFIRMVNKAYVDPDPAFWPRADRGSVGSSSNRWDLGLGEQTIPRPKGGKLPAASKSIAPFSSKVLYPNGLSGPPLGTGTAGQAFNTTGPGRKTGTQYGSSRAPLGYLEDEDIHIYSFNDIVDLDPAERSLLRQRVRIMRLLNKLDEIDNEFSGESLPGAE